MDLARGELAEETGLWAGSIEVLGHLFEAYGYPNQGFNVILATDLTAGEQSLDESENGAHHEVVQRGRAVVARG